MYRVYPHVPMLSLVSGVIYPTMPLVTCGFYSVIHGVQFAPQTLRNQAELDETCMYPSCGCDACGHYAVKRLPPICGIKVHHLALANIRG